jgi:hypothetical protein
MARDLLLGKTDRDWSCGSVLLPERQQRALFDKVDDVRRDVRHAGGAVRNGLVSLAIAVAAVAVASAYRTATSWRTR